MRFYFQIRNWLEGTYTLRIIDNFMELLISIGPFLLISIAVTYFDAPKDQEAELWIGSDDPIKAYVNGALAYNFNSVRTFANAAILSQIQKITIKKGINTLLVKFVQNSGTYGFSLNICVVESDPYMIGKRISGLKFMTDVNTLGVNNEWKVTPADFELLHSYPNPFNGSVQIPFVVRSGYLQCGWTKNQNFIPWNSRNPKFTNNLLEWKRRVKSHHFERYLLCCTQRKRR